jgi:hypothetical protein
VNTWKIHVVALRKNSKARVRKTLNLEWERQRRENRMADIAAGRYPATQRAS